MAGYATSLVHSLYPAEFAAINRNLGNLQNQAAQSFNERTVREKMESRRTSVDGSQIKAEADRDADGHWTPHRHKGKRQGSTMELLAGEGTIIDDTI